MLFLPSRHSHYPKVCHPNKVEALLLTGTAGIGLTDLAICESAVKWVIFQRERVAVCSAFAALRRSHWGSSTALAG